MLYTGFFLRVTDVVVVFTCVLVCDVIIVAQWRRLICFARDADADVCCFSRGLTYAIKWTRSAVAGMVICQDNKLRLGVRGNDTIYTWKLLPSVTLLTNITRICSGFKYCAFFNPVDTQGQRDNLSRSTWQRLSQLRAWSNLLGSRNVEQVSSFWASLEQNICSEEIDQTQKSQPFHRKRVFMRFLNAYQPRHLIWARRQMNDVYFSDRVKECP